MGHLSPETPITIQALIENAQELAALPQVVMRVIDITADPKAAASDLERIIGADQAMAADILRMANSAYYGLPRRIASIREAVVFLGFNSIREMAMAISTFNLFLGKSDVASLARRMVWRHSLNTALCARVVAGMLHPMDREKVEPEEAFTCGLLHDIGKMVIDQQLHPQYLQILERMRDTESRFYRVEQGVLPFNHSLVGAALASHWNLPQALCETIAFHHTPGAAQANPKLTATTFLANEIEYFIADQIKNPLLRIETLEEGCSEVLHFLRINQERLSQIISACRTELDKGFSLS